MQIASQKFMQLISLQKVTWFIRYSHYKCTYRTLTIQNGFKHLSRVKKSVWMASLDQYALLYFHQSTMSTTSKDVISTSVWSSANRRLLSNRMIASNLKSVVETHTLSFLVKRKFPFDASFSWNTNICRRVYQYHLGSFLRKFHRVLNLGTRL